MTADEARTFRPRSSLPVVLPAILAPLAVALAALAHGRLLLPALATLAVYPAMAILVARGRRGAAVAATLLWAASLSASVIALAARDPAGIGDLIIAGPAYREEMFAFIRSGSGAESDPRLFLPQHARHLAAFVLLAAGSGGLLGLALGAVLIAYMSYYIGSLRAGQSPLLALAFGWPPWAFLRVIAFVLLGTALSRPVLSVALRRPIPPVGGRTWYLWAAGLLLADAVLKGLLAPSWAALLRPCLGPGQP